MRVSGTRAVESHLRPSGRGQSQEETHRRSGPRDSHPEREHQHIDQGAGTEGQRGSEDPQRSQPADQVSIAGFKIQ